jgi:glycosyltransferase involved in cell wall biosynthesis
MRILFVSHDATRTGAPIVLLTLIGWLKIHADLDIRILLRDGGPMVEHFEALAPTYIWSPNKPSRFLLNRILSKILFKIIGKRIYEHFPAELERFDSDLVYLNTVASLDLAPIVKNKYKCPVIAHVHENEYTIDAYYPGLLSAKNKDAVDYYIAASNDTKLNLINNHLVPERQTSLFYEFIDVSKVASPNRSAGEMKDELNIGPSFVVGGSGLTSWRKGVDLFIAVCAYIVRTYPEEDIKFIWVGSQDHFFISQIKYELDRLNIADRIIFTGSQTNPHNYFQVFDLFLLSSREDPFPLVCLEAAALKKPVICFGNSGGMTEFTRLGGGINVPYGNIEQLAELIVRLKSDRVELSRLGAIAQKNIANFDINSVGPSIFSFIQSCIKSR